MVEADFVERVGEKLLAGLPSKRGLPLNEAPIPEHVTRSRLRIRRFVQW